MNKKSFYITTTLPYVNAEPHIGHAMEFVRADIIARWKKINGYDVFFNTGTDEHGQKVYKKSIEENKDIQKYVDQSAEKFKDLEKLLGLSEDVHFIRTTDEKHIKSAQEFWKLCDRNGFIEKKDYKIKYCVGCELEKTDSELIDGKCPLHPNLEIELIDEENYFFKFREFKDKLLEFYESNPTFVVPNSRFNEIKSFVSRGLEDFSISRLKEKMSWGVPVPEDDKHVMYVWFDALVNYVSTLGWPEDEENFEKYWKNGNPTQYCGKDNLRQQSAMWQAMLMAANLPNSHQIVINGFINSGNQKMSKSLGNVISPVDLIREYGTDAFRYYIAREINTFEDSDFTIEKFKEAYNSSLANGLGNLVARTIKMAVSYNAFPTLSPEKDWLINHSYASSYLEKFEIKNAIDEIWKRIADTDKLIQDQKPFSEIKTNPEQAIKNVQYYINEVFRIAWELQPFMPETSKKILNALDSKKAVENLFPRKD